MTLMSSARGAGGRSRVRRLLPPEAMLDSADDDTSLPQRPSGLFCATVTSARSLYPRSLW